MFRFSYLFVFVLIVSTATGQIKKLLVTVYYESECEDSRKFVENQLNPAVRLLHRYIELKLVPFGKAESINLEGEDVFRCQHGPSECMGNMVQSCALDLMENRSDVVKAEYVDCELQTKAGTVGNVNCVENAGIPGEKVNECIQSRRGVDLQLEAEFLTKQVRPKFIPTIVINDKFDQNIQDKALIDLEATLCFIIDKAPPCYKYFIRGPNVYNYYG